MVVGCQSFGILGEGQDQQAIEGGGEIPGTEAYLRGYVADPAGSGGPGSGGQGGRPAGCEHRLLEFEPIQVWTGHIENYEPSAMDRVEVRFAQLDEHGVTGQVVFGQGPWGDAYAVPPEEAPAAAGGLPGAFEIEPMTSGFAYTLLDGTLEGSRVRFQLGRYEPWCAWCGQQTSIPWDDGQFSCMPYATSGGEDPEGCFVNAEDTQARVYFSCQRFYGCLPFGDVCTCDVSGCGVQMSGYQFDVTVEGPTARGSLGPYSYGVYFDVRDPATGAGGAGGATQ